MTACDPVPTEPAAPIDLAGSEWSPGEGSKAFVAFKSEGKVIGSGGCNNFNGNYTQDGATVQIGPLATTRKMCPPDIMNMEITLLTALSKARTIETTHLNLTLMDENGIQIMNLQRTDWD